MGAGPECRWECVEDIQSCVAIVRCVGVSFGVDKSASRYILTHRKTLRGQRMCHKITSREERAFVCLLFAQVNMLGKSREREWRGLEEGFRIRMVFVGVWKERKDFGWVWLDLCKERKGMALTGFDWACVWKGRALVGEGDHLPTRSGFKQGPSLVVHLGLVVTRIWAGFCDHRWVGRELRFSRPAFASSSRQGAAVERACTAAYMQAKFSYSESVRCAYRLSNEQ